jgi:hypothetical protein
MRALTYKAMLLLLTACSALAQVREGWDGSEVKMKCGVLEAYS